MGTSSARRIAFGALAALLATGFSHAQTPQRPPIGGFGSPPDAMIFYVAHGAAGACGPDCSEWIAAEGTVQWDTYKRLLAILDRQAGRKPPVVIHVWGGAAANLNVATSLGRIMRDRGLDTMVGTTRGRSVRGQTRYGMLHPSNVRAGRSDAKMNLIERELRTRLRADAGRRRPSQPARRHQDDPERHDHP